MSDITATTGAAGATTTATQPTATLPPGYVAPPASAGTTSQGLNGVNAGTFLQLLVAQLQYQDPTSPVDSTQFLSQTAAFEEVQQLQSLQSSLSSLVSAQQAGAATALLGAHVTGTDANGKPVSGVVTEVQLTPSGPQLTVGDQAIAYSSVSTVTQASGTQASSSPTLTSSTGTGSGPSSTQSSPTLTSSPTPSSS